MWLKVLISGICFAVLDSLWFAFFMKKFAVKSLGPHLRLSKGTLSANLPYALMAYLLMIILAVFFLGPKITNLDSYGRVFFWGFVIGVCTFGVFDFTNGALMKNYPLRFMVIDTVWGGIMYGVTAIALKKFS